MIISFGFEPRIYLTAATSLHTWVSLRCLLLLTHVLVTTMVAGVAWLKTDSASGGLTLRLLCEVHILECAGDLVEFLQGLMLAIKQARRVLKGSTRRATPIGAHGHLHRSEWPCIKFRPFEWLIEPLLQTRVALSQLTKVVVHELLRYFISRVTRSRWGLHKFPTLLELQFLAFSRLFKPLSRGWNKLIDSILLAEH